MSVREKERERGRGRGDSREHDPRHSRSNDGATVDAVTTTTRNTSVFGAKRGDFLTFLVLPSEMTFEQKLERTLLSSHPHSIHLKNDSSFQHSVFK